MDAKKLQVDHRIPYEISGEQNEQDIDCFMLLSPSANRAKSWTCEHCENWDVKDSGFCVKCFWAHPEDYDHVAGKPEKMISIIFSGNEIDDYNKLILLAGKDTAQATIKKFCTNTSNKNLFTLKIATFFFKHTMRRKTLKLVFFTNNGRRTKWQKSI